MTCVKLYKATGERKHVRLIITQSRFLIRNLSEDLGKARGAGNGSGVDGGEGRPHRWMEFLKLRSPAHSNSKFRAMEN